MIALKVNSLSKYYDLDFSLEQSFRDDVSRKISSLLGHKRSSSKGKFWALRNISFELKKGEMLGIIGDNGAGKSTLLKILSDITQPSSGEVLVYGDIASILEIGTGFHPELTGRENIYLTGSIMGMPKERITKQLDQIIEFSGIGSFVNVPVKKYSSGMFVRLAFSVIAHLEADILFLDEIFSVGDAEFKIKSLQKIKDLRKAGKSIILVSHDLNAIGQYCDRCLILDKGKMAAYGSPSDLVTEYIEDTIWDIEHKGSDQESSETKDNRLKFPTDPIEEQTQSNEQESETQQNESMAISDADAVESSGIKRSKPRNEIPLKRWEDEQLAPGNEFIRIKEIVVCAVDKEPADKIMMEDSFYIQVHFNKVIDRPTNLSYFLNYRMTQPTLSVSPFRSTSTINIENDDLPGFYTARCTFPGNLFNRGLFSVDLYFVDDQDNLICELQHLISFVIHYEKDLSARFVYSGNFPGPVFPVLNWDLKRN